MRTVKTSYAIYISANRAPRQGQPCSNRSPKRRKNNNNNNNNTTQHNAYILISWTAVIWKMHLIYMHPESIDWFRQHSTIRQWIPHINNAFRKGMTITSRGGMWFIEFSGCSLKLCDPCLSASEASFSQWGAIQIQLPFTASFCLLHTSTLSVGVGSMFGSVCLFVCPQYNSKTNDLKVFKLDVGMIFGYRRSDMVWDWELKGQRSRSHGLRQ